MPGKVVAKEGEELVSLLRRFRQEVNTSGGLLVGERLRQADRHRRKDRYLKPSEKRRQRQKVAWLRRMQGALRRRMDRSLPM